jgi:hypothetical protein
MTRDFYPDPAAISTLRRIPFVRELHYKPVPGGQDQGYDGEIDIQTPDGHFHLFVETKRSFLTRSAINEFLVWIRHARAAEPDQVILLARHVPRPVAERLIEAKVNFADDVGNVHLALRDRYSWTSIGAPASQPTSERRAVSAAQLQLLFQFVTYPESVNWPVRRLEAAAGISKSKVAQARQQLLATGLITKKGNLYQLGSKELLTEHLSSGYAQVLRPKLSIGRFRFAEKTPELFLARLKNHTPPHVRYALTGGQAANVLQRYYRGSDVSMFIDPAQRQTAQELRLLPDREGPATLLRAFGKAVFWEEHDGHMLASPWLVYAELLIFDDPRAHEAAREFRKQFLT